MKYAYILMIIVMLVFFGYAVKNVMTFADNIHKRVDMINHAIEGK